MKKKRINKNYIIGLFSLIIVVLILLCFVTRSKSFLKDKEDVMSYLEKNLEIKNLMLVKEKN